MAKRFLAFGVAALALGALSAQAAVVVTWTGTVFDGNDPADYFGVGPNANPLGNLQGQAFTAQFTIDPTVGSVTSAADYFDVRGGTFTGAFASPLISATLTINGVTYSYGSSYFGGYQRDATPGRSVIYTEANQEQAPGVFDVLVLYEFRPNNSIPFAGLGESLTVPLPAAFVANFQAFAPGGAAMLFNGHFSPTQVTIAPSTPGGGGPDVPEPSTAVLVSAAAAFALILRRRGQRPV